LIVTGSSRTIIQKFKHIIDRTDPRPPDLLGARREEAARGDDAGHRTLGEKVIPALPEC
jgi:hypothetical protein